MASAARAVMLGEADAYVGGGVESMSRAPWAVPKPERAFPTGHATMYDTTLGWRFVNPRMEELGHTDSLGHDRREPRRGALPRHRRGADSPRSSPTEYDVSREAQDRFALRSHEKAVAAQDGKRFRDEIVPVKVKTRKGARPSSRPTRGPRRDTTLEKLGKLRPAFKEDGQRHGGQLQLPQRRGRGGAGGLGGLRRGARPRARWPR